MTLRVLHVRSSAGVAGPERQILELARRLPGEGVEVGVVVLVGAADGAAPAHPLRSACAREGRKCWELSVGRYQPAAGARRLAALIERESFDLVHAHDYKANALVARLGTAVGGDRPTIATVHLHTRSTLRLRLYAALDRRQLRRFPAVILVSRALEDDPAVRRLAPSRRHLVHNGIDPELLSRQATEQSPDARAALEPAGSGPRLLAVGRLAEQKGFDLLLDACARLLPRFPSLRLAVAGSGPDAARLAARARALRLETAVRWLGQRADIAGLMSVADLVVLPSRREGLPYVALEALGLSRPLVATTAGGLPELIRDDIDGSLVAAGDVEALANALAFALANPARARAWGHSGRARVEALFHARDMARATANLYRRLAA